LHLQDHKITANVIMKEFGFFPRYFAGIGRPGGSNCGHDDPLVQLRADLERPSSMPWSRRRVQRIYAQLLKENSPEASYVL
jgi:hypothetical protein